MQGQLHTMRIVVVLAVWALVVADVFDIAAGVPSVRQASARIDAGAISKTIGATIGWQVRRDSASYCAALVYITFTANLFLVPCNRRIRTTT